MTMFKKIRKYHIVFFGTRKDGKGYSIGSSFHTTRGKFNTQKEIEEWSEQAKQSQELSFVAVLNIIPLKS